MSEAVVDREALQAARDDVAAFGAVVGVPLEPWQAEPLALETRHTNILAARQMGKSRALAVLAVHRSLRSRNHRTLIVSAGEEGAKRLLAEVRRMLDHPLLRGVTLDESSGLVTFVNGSEVRAVPASERQIRGWSNDLLIVDEAAYVPDDVVFGAALPTTAARPDARIVFASTAWSNSGAFWASVTSEHPQMRTFRWRIEDASWITPEFLALMKATMPPLKFRAEFESEFVDGGEGLFSRTDLLDATADYRLVSPEDASGGTVMVGLDWGRMRDAHAMALLAVLDDDERNGRPILLPVWLERSRRPYAEQVAAVERLVSPGVDAATYATLAGPTQGRRISPARGRYQVERIVSEANGVGAYPTEALMTRLGAGMVRAQVTTMQSKEAAFSRLSTLLGGGQFVLPRDPQLLGELSALTATPTENGGVRIGGADGHPGDMTMALAQALLGLPRQPSPGLCLPRRRQDPYWDQEWTATPSGIAVPVNPRPRVAAMRPEGAYVVGA